MTDATLLAAPRSAPRPGWPAAGPALAVLLAGAGLIHVAMAPPHLADDAVLGAGFLGVGFVQLVLAAVALTRPGRIAWLAMAAVSAGSIAAWALSRTAGLPFGAHEGVAEPVALVDGVAAALEVVAVIVAVALVVRPAPRSEPLVVPVFARAATAMAVVATLVAVASPSAREHGGGEHGHGGAAHEEAGGHGHDEPVDDLGYSLLANGEMAHDHGEEPVEPVALTSEESGALALQLAATADLVAAYPTIGDAKAAGYTQSGPFAPGLGIHYSPPGMSFNGDGDMDPEDLANGMLIFDGTADDAPIAGFMYLAFQEEAPEGFVGGLDRWHSHSAVCIVSTPEGIETPFGADLEGITQEMCEAEGGQLLDFTGFMVHVWTVPGYESPEGVFSDLNPKLTCPDGTYYKIPTREIGSADTTCRT